MLGTNSSYVLQGLADGNCTENCTTPEDPDVYDYTSYDIKFRARYILSKPSFIVAITLGVIGVLANTISLIAIMKIRKSLTSYLRIVISLLMSDLLVALSLLAYFVSTILLPLYRPGYGPWQPRVTSRCTFMVIKAVNTMGLNVILLNLMAMAINHYVAILQPFQLHILLSRTRTNIMIFILWGIALIAGFSDFFSPIGELDEFFYWQWKFNYCEFIWLTKYQEEFITFAIALVCLVSMLFIYLRILFEVRYKSNQEIVARRSNSNTKAVITTFFILVSFAVCWLPLCMFNIVLIIVTRGGDSGGYLKPLIPYLGIIEEYFYDLILLNTLCDPLIYGVRIKEVRRGYRLLFKCSPQQSPYRSRTSHFSLVDNNHHRPSFQSLKHQGSIEKKDESPKKNSVVSFKSHNPSGPEVQHGGQQRPHDDEETLTTSLLLTTSLDSTTCS